ncbi:hypothetical protein GQ607_003227 [Colletotrichum asianum]|uniref:Secreted protein n=1 Tax=Colletotrichum asianum TaxID=702518 RepID=A0A8H3WMM0_9PEZI|nr:hypothetical protein GQ607_003227 [Colletotrichum asianum]
MSLLLLLLLCHMPAICTSRPSFAPAHQQISRRGTTRTRHARATEPLIGCQRSAFHPPCHLTHLGGKSDTTDRKRRRRLGPAKLQH